MLIQKLKRNLQARDLIVGDIHGAYEALQAHLDVIGFDPATDRLLSVGDIVDRGPGSEQCLKFLRQPWFFACRGNHETMCCKVYDGTLSTHVHAWNGGAWFLGLTRAEQGDYVAAFRDLPLVIELETAEGIVGIVHAECPVNDWADLRDALEGPNGHAFQTACMWSRRRMHSSDTTPVAGVRAVVVGHTVVDRVTKLGNTLYIDTGGVYEDGRFTVIDAATLRQARMLVAAD